ncbi:MAG: M48 family metallopeptidase [Sedimentisphaerales bacterium]|nr:M48 family metallopeptidase [Sedimentisphaerales bacterium]
MKTALRMMVMAVLGLVLAVAGCSQVGITGRSQLTLLPESYINSMSLQQYSQFIGASDVKTGTANGEMVTRCGRRIVGAVDEFCRQHMERNPFAGYEWEFNLVEDPNVNAFAMPGGKVVVYTGLLPVAQNEAGLAVVMGHEIAHVFARHGNERMSHQLLVQLGGIAIDQALKEKPEATRNLFSASYGLGSQIGILLPYSRKHESEADRLGMIFMALGGYDPHEALTFWQRMAAQSSGARPPEILSTHPANETRIQDIQAHMAEAMEYYRPLQ